MVLMKQTRLGIYYHVPCYRVNDDIFMPGYFGRFIDSLAKYFHTVVCLLHEATPPQKVFCDYRISEKNVQWSNLGHSGSAIQRTFLNWHYINRAKQKFSEIDILLIRGPSPLLPSLANSFSQKPLALLIVGDYMAGIDTSPQPSWRKALIRLWIKLNTWGQEKAAQRALTFVNSQKLFQDNLGKIPELRLIHTTTLSQSDFYERNDTCQSLPVHLLYTGRISLSKGMFDILSAVDILVKQNKEILFDIAGWEEPGEEGIIGRMQKFAECRGIADRINFLGYKALGPDLFKCYQNADIYILASRSNFEGFPRALWEAMASSLPVIATRVGSIPSFVEDSVELIEPCQPRHLAEKIIHLMNTPSLRQRIILKGRSLAEQNTLEYQTQLLVSNIETWMAQK